MDRELEDIKVYTAAAFALLALAFGQGFRCSGSYRLCQSQVRAQVIGRTLGL